VASYRDELNAKRNNCEDGLRELLVHVYYDSQGPAPHPGRK
jgi:hypothetical protein